MKTNDQAMADELRAMIARFERRHHVTLSGHIRFGDQMLWFHHDPERGDFSMLAELLKIVDQKETSDECRGTEPVGAGHEAQSGE